MNLSEFLPNIYLEAPGCPEAVALNALRYTLREFCEKSRVWQKELDGISITEGYSEYDIDTPPGSELVTVLSATYNESHPPMYTPDEMLGVDVNWRTDTGTGVSYIVIDNKALHVVPVPDADDDNQVYLRVVLKPTYAATTCDDIIDQWREGIASGALSRLKAIPGKPWSDRDSVAYYTAVFGKAVRNARMMVLNGFTERAFKVTPTNYY